ncbi:hypothetical protein WA026_017729 [Henosepilachna vigintioctopunctata]|uniref:Sulfotransferase domain-containing protein n=1 Tax=Henosepilachna vigintioctopunctata TaxID=420089 RepID=A0AAW1U8C5_9CUCU
MSFTVKPIVGEYADKLERAFGFKNALFEYNPGKCLMPICFSDIAQQVLEAPVRDDDIWLISFPRTGSTWCQEMIWAIGNNFDFETARKTVQQMRAPLIELSTAFAEYYDTLGELIGNSVEYVANQPSPRYVKSHLPYPFLPTELDKVKPKIVYTARNPKDLCVSYYHHCKMFHNLNTSFEEFCDLFMNDHTPLGSLWTHYLPFWNKRHETNIFFLKYEDMKTDFRGTVQKLADFMEKSITEEQIDDLQDFLSIEKMRDNKGCNLQMFIDTKRGKDYYKRSGQHFIRRGVVGDHLNHMTPEMIRKFDEWIEKNTRGTGLSFE